MKLTIIYLLSLIAIAFSAVIPTKTPSVTWYQTINCHDNGGSENDIGYFVEPISDGSGFYVGGATNSFGPNSYDIYDNTDACIFKFTPQGELLWYKTIGINGTALTGSDFSHVIRETSDGGVIVPVCMTDTSIFMLVRFDKNGNLLWQKNIPIEKKRYSIKDMHQTSDSGFVLVGGIESTDWVNRAVWITRFDKSGNQQWEKQYVLGTSKGVGLIKDQTKDNFIIVADADTSTYDPMFATTTRYNYAWLLKINETGDTVWTKRYQGLNPISVSKIGDTAFIIASSTTEDMLVNTSAQIAAFSLTGDSLWVKSIKKLEVNSGKAVTALEDGTLLFAGYSFSSTTNATGTWIVCYNSKGDSLWHLDFNYRNRQICSVRGLKQNSYIIAGAGVPEGFSGSTDIWLRKGNTSAPSIDFETFLGGRSDDIGSSITPLNQGYLITGFSQRYQTSITVFIRTDAKGNLLWKKDLPSDIGKPFKTSADTMLFAGRDSTGFFITCTDTLANIKWKKAVHHDTTRSYYMTCFPAKNGGYYLVGDVNWNTGIIIRLDDNLNKVWFKSYPNTLIYDGLQQRNQNLVFLTESALIMGTDTLGNLIWSHTIPMPAGNYGDGLHGTKLVEANDEHLTVFAGISSGPYHQYIIHTDASGNELWHKVYNNKYPWNETVLVNNNEYLIAGSTAGDQDKYIAYIDSSANFKWEKIFSSNGALREKINAFHLLPTGNIITVCSEQSSIYKDWDIIIAELQKNDTVRVLHNSSFNGMRPLVQLNNNKLTVTFPSSLSISGLSYIELFSLDGKRLFKKAITSSHTELLIDKQLSKLFASGLHIVKITTTNNRWIYQLTKMH